MQDDPSKYLARTGLTRQVRTQSRFRAVSQNTAGSSTGHLLLGSPGSLLGQPLAELEAGACAELAGARCGVSMNRSDSNSVELTAEERRLANFVAKCFNFHPQSNHSICCLRFYCFQQTRGSSEDCLA